MESKEEVQAYDKIVRHQFPIFFFQTVISLTVLCLLWTVFIGFSNQIQLNHLLKNEIKAQQLSENIVYFDEVLTMSARLAILAQDPRWEKRYDTYVIKLDNALATVINSLPKEFDLILHEKSVSKAHEQLVKIERKALALASKGQYRKAKALLFSEQYERYKNKYKEGINNLSQTVLSLMDKQINQHRELVYKNGLVIAFCITILIGFSIA